MQRLRVPTIAWPCWSKTPWGRTSLSIYSAFDMFLPSPPFSSWPSDRPIRDFLSGSTPESEVMMGIWKGWSLFSLSIATSQKILNSEYGVRLWRIVSEFGKICRARVWAILGVRESRKANSSVSMSRLSSYPSSYFQPMKVKEVLIWGSAWVRSNLKRAVWASWRTFLTKKTCRSLPSAAYAFVIKRLRA